MKKITLSEAFESTFHKKYGIEDFASLDVAAECITRRIHKSELREFVVSAPSEKLKRYQRFLNNFIFDYADINQDVVHSYRTGKNVYSSLERHAANRYFYQTDIWNFFPSITVSDVHNIISAKLANSLITDLVSYRDVIVNLVTIKGGVPKGFSTSPNISNSVLFEFDNQLASLCDRENVTYTRYSDDLILSAQDMLTLNTVVDELPQLLAQYSSGNFALNNRKTKYTHIGNKVKMLGLVILPTGKITVDMRIKEAIEVMLHFYVSDQEKYKNYVDVKLKGNLTRVSGQLHYINTIDPDYVLKLRRKYGNYVVEYFSSGSDL